MSFPVKPSNDPQILTLDHPRTGREITLRLADWEKIPGKDRVTGLDNIRLFATRPADFCRQGSADAQRGRPGGLPARLRAKSSSAT